MTTYVKKTWITNETITKDALNNIETGVSDGFNWSEQIIDSDKDMQGYDLSNIGRLDADNFGSVDAVSNLKLDLGDDSFTASGIIASFTVAPLLGAGSVLRTKATITASTNSGNTTQLLIKHGTDILASGTILNPGEIDNFSETITVTGGWQIDFYLDLVLAGAYGTGTANDKEVHCRMPDEFVEV